MLRGTGCEHSDDGVTRVRERARADLHRREEGRRSREVHRLAARALCVLSMSTTSRTIPEVMSV